jgi:acetylornithine deacetylase
MLAARDLAGDGLAGDVMLELVPGEEDCVGLGTLTSIARGVKADAAIVLEPTESLPRCASRAGCRFEITCRGRAIHGTVKWEGKDAIRLARAVLDALDTLEARWNDRAANRLFAAYPIARPITVDKVSGGRWQGMICDECLCAGYLELLPDDNIAVWERRLARELPREVACRGHDAGNVDIQFTERYNGHQASPQSPLSRVARRAAGGKGGWSAFNAGCEAGTRAHLLGTPTLVWGPGSLSLAHADNERIRFSSVQRVAASFTRLVLDWCGERFPREEE